MMNHRKRDRIWTLAAVVWMLSVSVLIVVLSGCRTAEKSPDTARQDSYPCRCGERETLKENGR